MVIVLLLGLFFLCASTSGYCHSSTIAHKSIGRVSNNESTLRIGSSPAFEAIIAIGPVAGSGIYGRIGAYLVWIGSYQASRPTTVRYILDPSRGEAFRTDYKNARELLIEGGPYKTFDELIWINEFQGKPVVNRLRIVNSNVVHDTLPSIPEVYDTKTVTVRSPSAENMCAGAIVLVTAAYVYFWWTST